MTNALRLLAALLVVAVTVSASAKESGTVRFVYVGSSGCGMCKRPDYRKRIAEIRDAARQWARAHHHSFESVGVATDEGKDLGERFLAESGIGPFDRTISGQGWAGADPYVKAYRHTNAMFLGGTPMEVEPQVVVLFERRKDERPREAVRDLGSMILMGSSVDYVGKSLDHVSSR